MSRLIDEYGRTKFDLDEFKIALKKLADKMEERRIRGRHSRRLCKRS